MLKNSALFAAYWVTPCLFAATVFTDDFGRVSLGAGYTGSPSAGSDGAAAINASSFLELTNDASAAANANGRVSAAVAFTGFTGPFSGTLANNPGLVTWETNLRYNRATNPSGFGSGGYGLAFVLAASQADFTAGSGYAVVYGNSATPDPIRLVRYTGGLILDSNLTDIINGGAANLSAVNNYASIRVTYDPTGDRWSLYVRDDGASAWADPTTLGAGHQVGAVITDSTHTAASLTHAGYFWNYATAATQTAQFDNLTVSVIPEPGTYAAGATALLAVTAAARRRQKKTPARTPA